MGGEKRYTGKPVTFNFQDVPVRTVLQLMAEESGLNLVVADSVGGSVTLRLINVPWDQAMDIVLRAKGLDKRRDGNVVWVAPQAELSNYELALNQARINLENSAEVVSEYIPISYANATAIAQLLSTGGASGGGSGGGQQQRGFLSPRGSVIADDRTNTLLVVDIPKKVDEIKRLLETLDRPVDQVLIEARVVIADDTFSRDIGARLGLVDPRINNGSTSAVGGNIEGNVDTINSINSTARTNAVLQNAYAAAYSAWVAGGMTGAAPATPNFSAPTYTPSFITNLPVQGGGSLAFSILRNSNALNLELTAMEQEGRGEVVSNPRVITSNQREAIITQGDEIGYITPVAPGAGQALATPAFKEALLELKVTPTITQDGRVFLAINLKKDDVKSFIAGVPTLTKRAITTAVLVDSGSTVVIGGVYEFRNRNDVQGMPWLKDLPILGNLFKKTGKSHSKAELLMFITPQVLQVPKR